MVGSCILFSMLAIFTYVNFHLAAPPFHLGTAALGYVFLVYLVGGVITPVAGRWIDRLRIPQRLCRRHRGEHRRGSAHARQLTMGGGCRARHIQFGHFHHPGQRQWPHRQRGGAQPGLGGRLIRFVLLRGRWHRQLLPAWLWDIGGWNGCVGLCLVQLSVPPSPGYSGCATAEPVRRGMVPLSRCHVARKAMLALSSEIGP